MIFYGGYMTDIKATNRDLYVPAAEIINSRKIPEATNKQVDSETEKLRNEIGTLPDTVKNTGECRYISVSGSRDNDGKTPETAWDSLETLERNRGELKAGTAVLFRRGDIFRGCITAADGVNYGAYGSGEKPRIYGSARDYINDSWYRLPDGLWTVDADFPADVGNIIFDKGRAVGIKKTNRADISEEFDFWSDHKNGNRIVIRLKDDPVLTFKSIEIAHNLWLFRMDSVKNTLIENLTFCFCGGHGIRATEVRDVRITGCEFFFIGGCFLTEYKNGDVRYGNAIEFMRGCKNSVVKNCIAYQIYDSGITHQGYGDYCAEDMEFTGNILEYCGMGSVEYWLGQDSKCVNITYSGNIMRFAGYGFGGLQRPDKNMTAHIQSNGACLNFAENFVIENNIFELSTYDLINAQSRMNTLPVLRGNTYIQNENRRLGSYSGYIDCMFDSAVGGTVKNLWHDEGAKINSPASYS